MTPEGAGATVVSLESHPRWRAGQRRSRELAAAMRRHPSCQGTKRLDVSDQSYADVVPLPRRRIGS